MGAARRRRRRVEAAQLLLHAALTAASYGYAWRATPSVRPPMDTIVRRSSSGWRPLHAERDDADAAVGAPAASPPWSAPRMHHLEQWSRQLAIETLLPVLAPAPGEAPVPAEAALRRALRRLGTAASDTNTAPSKTAAADDLHRMRSRLAALVLGAAVWRGRYEYMLQAQPGSPVVPTSASETVARMVDLHMASLDNHRDKNERDDEGIVWPRSAADRLAAQESLPPFLAAALVDQYGDRAARRLARALNRPGPVTVRRNALRCRTDQDLIDRAAAEGGNRLQPLENVLLPLAAATANRTAVWGPPPGCLRLTRSSLGAAAASIWSMPAWRDGWFEVQDTGSQLIVQATEAAPGEAVVDYCAGNGGKTLALASRVKELAQRTADTAVTSRIWAHDTAPERLRQLTGSLPRAGLHEPSATGASMCLITTVGDATLLPDGMADVVLVDAPCSSSGALRRRPSQRWSLTEESARLTLPALQLEILRNASRLVRPRGGRLVYATCSLLRWENEDVAGAWEREAGSAWEPWPFDAEAWPLVDDCRPHHRALLPHVHDSDGFFIARWKKR